MGKGLAVVKGFGWGGAIGGISVPPPALKSDGSGMGGYVTALRGNSKGGPGNGVTEPVGDGSGTQFLLASYGISWSP